MNFVVLGSSLSQELQTESLIPPLGFETPHEYKQKKGQGEVVIFNNYISRHNKACGELINMRSPMSSNIPYNWSSQPKARNYLVTARDGHCFSMEQTTRGETFQTLACCPSFHSTAHTHSREEVERDLPANREG